MEENKTLVRPIVKDFFPTIEEAHESYLAAPNLFKYVQALDNYIDELEATPVSEYAYIEMPVEKVLPENEGLYIVKMPGGYIEVFYNKEYSFHMEFTDCSGVTKWLKKVPISSLVAKRDTISPQAQPEAKVSDEAIEQMANEIFGEDSMVGKGFWIAGYKAALSNQSITD